MLISLNWIKDFVPLKDNLDLKEFGELVTVHTAEVEGYTDLADSFNNIVVGKIKSIKPHPDADKLTVTETDIGGKTHQIVCGANNIYEGMYAPVALPGAKVKWHGEGELVELKPTKVRGVQSDGMLCAGEEIGLENKVDGIYDFKGMDVKEGMPLAKVFSKNDVVFEIDNKSLTHRPDLWGHYGMAREIAAITDNKLKKLEPKVTIPSKGESPDIEVKDYDLCPRYCGLTITGVKVEESPKWLADRLMAVGYRPISNIVDITNYVMAELGQPLHAFDKDYIKKGIIVRRAEKNEKITTLDGQERKLDDKMLVIADHEKPVAIAGVMGGENSEINDGTTEVIIESANFNPQSIRTTSTRLGLRTEAVQRFEKSLDPHMAELAIKRTAELILQLCPDAKIAGPITDKKKISLKELTITLDTQNVSSKIGVPISLKQCTDILESLEFGVHKKSDTLLEVLVPTFRATKDIDIEDDLVEEIVRIYGYDNVEPTLPALPIKSPTENVERTRKHHARNLLSYGFGLTEIYNYSFYGQNDLAKCLMNDKHHLQLQNYLSQDETHLRTTLAPNLFKNIADNLRYHDALRFYEIGRTYKEIGEYFPLEEKWISGAVVLPKKAKLEAFYDVKSIAGDFLKQFSKHKVELYEAKDCPVYAHPSRCATIKVRGQEVGFVFEAHPQVLKNFDIEAKVAMFEINFTKLAAIDEPLVKHEQLPKFQGLDIDISVVIDRKKTVGDIEKEIRKADKNLIKRVKLFDLYEGEHVEKDKKALAFRVLLQASDRTLTDEEMSSIQKKIFQNLEKIGGVIRGK